MFPNVRLLIAAVVASVVALSCGFAMFATFRVNHEPLSRLATGAAPLQLAAGNPSLPPASESFGGRFPANQPAIGDAPAAAVPPEPDHEDGAPSTVASTTATAPETNAAEPEPSAPEPPAVAQAAATEPKQDEAAVTPSEPPPAATETAAMEPPAVPAAPAEQAAPTERASQESNQESNTDNKTDTATTTAAQPPAPEAHPKAAHRHRVAAKAQHARQARAFAQPGIQAPGIGGSSVLPTNRIAARPPRARQARATVQPVSQPSGVGGPFVPPTGH